MDNISDSSKTEAIIEAVIFDCDFICFSPMILQSWKRDLTHPEEQPCSPLRKKCSSRRTPSEGCTQTFISTEHSPVSWIVAAQPPF